MKIKIVEDKGQNPNKINASVQNIGQTSLTTDSGKLPVYYVIVGCGTAAMVNHTTLRQTEWGKKRIGDLPLMHIGFKDPWTQYFEHGMGQPPYLLGMPGYQKRPSQETDVFAKNPGCSSVKFGACTEHEWNLLRAKYHHDDPAKSRFHHKEGWVAFIQKKTDLLPEKLKKVIKDLKEKEEIDLTVKELDEKLQEKFPSDEPDYRLVVLVPESEEECRIEFVYAKKIDICTGAGRSAVRFDEKKLDNRNAVKMGKTKLCVPPRLWSEETKKRRVINGPEALMTKTIWNKTDRVCVFGSGGIGLNMVERGEGEKCHIDWMARTLAASFNLPRNDTVLRHPDSLYNVNRVKKEDLEIYLKKKLKDASEIGELVVPLLKGTYFLTKEELKTDLLKHSETNKNTVAAAFFGQIANSEEMMTALDPKAGRRIEPGESGVREGAFLAPTNENFVLTPSDKKWRFGKGCELDVFKIGGDSVIVDIEPSSRGMPNIPEIRDYYERNTAHDKGAFVLSDDYKRVWDNLALLNEDTGGIYQRLCITTGLVGGELGEPFATAAVFTLENLTVNGRTVGLQSDGGAVRILGAAAQTHPSDYFKIGIPNQTQARDNDPASFYFFTLPMSAVVPGFIFSGINIALANQYFDEANPNTNVNTMTLDEVGDWFLKHHPEFPLPANLALKIIKYRRFQDGYRNLVRLRQTLAKEESYDSVKENFLLYDGWRDLVNELRTDYPPARDFLD